jgi:hypothetical protein
MRAAEQCGGPMDEGAVTSLDPDSLAVSLVQVATTLIRTCAEGA